MFLFLSVNNNNGMNLRIGILN